MATERSEDALVWIDCEMTGLDRENDTIMSIACFITDADLRLLDKGGFDTIIHHPKSTMDRMDDWCTKTHGTSGLTDACIRSNTTPTEAANDLLQYIQRYIPMPKSGVLAGNSVHCDKEFLNVSSIKEAARRWAPEDTLIQIPLKKGLHQAREDILESIEEAKFYRQTFFGCGKKD